MTTTAHSNTLSQEDLVYLLNLPEVQTSKETIDAKSSGTVYFSVSLTPSIKTALYERLGIDLSAIESIPMRWIKGDTRPHIDTYTRVDDFVNTYLMYVTDSPGSLVVDGTSYPITQGSAYVFNEGLQHETIDTGLEPRLLLGPMSEKGISVGAITEISCCEKPLYLRHLDYTTQAELISGSTLIGNFNSRREPLSHSDIIKIKKAYVFKR